MDEGFDILFTDDIKSTLTTCFEKGGVLTVYPKGTSMLPTLKQGRDSVELSPVTTVEKNGIYLYQRPSGAFALHRLFRIKDGKYIFCGDNQLVFEEVAPSQLLAQVSRIYKNGKHADNSLCFKTMVALNSLFPLRKLRIRLSSFSKRFLKKR